MRNNTPQLVAGGDIRPCRFVKQSTAADFAGLEADANEVTLGISGEGTELPPIPQQTTAYHASSGKPIDLLAEGDICFLEAGSGGWTRGGRLISDADGKGVACATTGTTIQNIGAIALESASAGEKARVQVRHESYRPALT